MISLSKQIASFRFFTIHHNIGDAFTESDKNAFFKLKLTRWCFTSLQTYSRKILAIAGSNFDVWDILWKLFSMILFKKPAKQPPSWAELKAGFKQVEVVVSTISYFLLDSQAGQAGGSNLTLNL